MLRLSEPCSGMMMVPPAFVWAEAQGPAPQLDVGLGALLTLPVCLEKLPVWGRPVCPEVLPFPTTALVLILPTQPGP